MKNLIKLLLVSLVIIAFQFSNPSQAKASNNCYISISQDEVIPSYLRQGINADKQTLAIAIEMYKQGWKYTMPSPKSTQARWGNSDGRTTWWYGSWYNKKTKTYSNSTPKKQSNGTYTGDGSSYQGSWRRGGSPSRPSKIEWLLSTSGGIKPY